MTLNAVLRPFKTFRRILYILRQTSPRLMVVTPLLAIVEVAAGFALLYIAKLTLDLLAAGGRGIEVVSVETVMLYIAAAGGFAALYLVARALASLASEAQALAVADHVDQKIHAHAVLVDYAFYESPAYFDTLQRARQAGNQRPAQVVGNLIRLAKNLLFVVVGTIFVALTSPLLLVIIGIFIALLLGVRLVFTRTMYTWRIERTQMERRAGYLDWLVTSEHHAKELRLNQLGDLFRGQYADLRTKLRREQFAITRRRSIAELVVGILGIGAFFLSVLFLVSGVSRGEESLGTLALYLILFQRAQTIGQAIAQQISQLYADHLYLQHLFAFLDMPTRAPSTCAEVATPTQAAIDKECGDLCFEDVSFTYPGTDKEVLSDINLKVPPGQFIALVGANGSGKTSLIKLLSRLYAPTSGRITYNGVDLEEIPIELFRANVSVLFQDYARYADTLHENIRFGNVASPSGRPGVIAAAKTSSAHDFATTLPSGYDSLLTRMFDDGVELSVGQWQKVAMARAFFRRSRILVLDEPTSALDPTAEAQLFDRFSETLGKRSALVISHRLSTIRHADRIFVLEGGRIIEAGTHSELLAEKGAYASMYTLQGRYFQQ